MDWFKNLKLAGKFTFVGVALLGLMAITVSVGFKKLAHIGASGQAVARDDVRQGLRITEATNNMLLFRVRQVRQVLEKTSDPKSDISALVKNTTEAKTAADQAVKALIENEAEAETLGELKQLKEGWSEYVSSTAQLSSLIEKGDFAKANEVVSDSGAKVFGERVESQIADLKSFQEKDATATIASISQEIQNATIWLLGVFGAAIVVSTFFIRYITKSIRSVTTDLIERFSSLEGKCVTGLGIGMQKFAEGDLTFPVIPKTSPSEYVSKDEFGQIATIFNSLLSKVQGTVISYTSAQESLSGLVGEISKSALNVNETSVNLDEASKQSGAASEEIAKGSEKLAQSASDVASTMDRLLSQIDQVANSSERQSEALTVASSELSTAMEAIHQVGKASQQMTNTAVSGNGAVQKTVIAMEEIRAQVTNSSSKVQELDEAGQQIGQIVLTIEQIAEQTNLLALNAAIEAARAGEHGRGFAVVADEVRKLAEQAGSATKEISTLISSVRSLVADTVSSITRANLQVEEGASCTTEAGAALASIVASAQTLADEANRASEIAVNVAKQMESVEVLASANKDATFAMAGSAEAVGQTASEVAAISEESSAGAQQLSASIEQASASAEVLSQMANDLTNQVMRFKVKEISKSPLKIAA